ncbi:hypothetical protein F4553_002390 [Allocatelliglobosispora scoriae]|uniref:DUF6745 domain-containing protein n=1 Tax=Allocatelliglobosispora scoriae TaxID=643052 RepID=A0A841BQA4_9ACTN|nr:hypothetical protein [Allocatelliglobosispora scoriae]MBB5869011.1 hypothetical protein [Allocatelliglobosispora scoriae]
MTTETVQTPDTTLAARADEWLDTGLTCVPADRAAAEAGVRRAYADAGLTPPEQILWFGSPAAAAVAIAMLRTGETGGAEQSGVRDLLFAQSAFPGQTVLGGSVRPKVRTGPWARARAELVAQLGGVGFARHWAASSRRPWQQLVEQIVTPLRTRLDAQFAADSGPLGAASREAMLDPIFGQHDAAWLGAFDEGTAELAGLAAVARSAGWWWAFEHLAIITERPREVHRDNLGRLHHGDGAALSYPDGFGLHAWRGMPIPAEVADELGSLTVERIRAEDNAEIRRVMLEHFGFDRYLRDSGAARTQSDECGVLWRVELPGDEPLVMVEVINSTAEPDGTFRTYFLRVPPTIRTARAGVAWTFDLTEAEYSPLQQT